MLAIKGAGSSIAQKLIQLLPDEEIQKVGRDNSMPLSANRYVFCNGLIRPLRITEQTEAQIGESIWVNFGSVVEQCDVIFEMNDVARICVIGSESAFKGSYDGTYAAAKASLQEYVATKRLRTPEQQLVCVAPTIIRDSAMTQARADQDAVTARGLAHPKGRWLEAFEVARLIHFLLYKDAGYISGVTIRVNGGGHTI